MLKSIPNGMWVKSLEYKLCFFFFFDSAKAQSVEEELIGSHREEASQLRKVISQKEDELHKTVQKYEQVIQVLWKIICFFYGFYDGKGIRTNAAASPSLTQDTTHQLLMFWIICHVRTFFLFFTKICHNHLRKYNFLFEDEASFILESGTQEDN